MKLRIEGNSLRVRVKKSDLEQLRAEHLVRETVSFIKGFDFHYELSLSDSVSQIGAIFSHATITIEIPLSMAQVWIETDQVGLENTLSNGQYILIEKDFPCKTRLNEDKNDLFQELSIKNCNI